MRFHGMPSPSPCIKFVAAKREKFAKVNPVLLKWPAFLLRLKADNAMQFTLCLGLICIQVDSPETRYIYLWSLALVLRRSENM